MEGYRIKIIKSKMDSYWYAGLIDQQFWAVLVLNDNEEKEYKIVPEGATPLPGFSTKTVAFDDCTVIKKSKIQIESNVVVTVIEI